MYYILLIIKIIYGNILDRVLYIDCKNTQKEWK